jgi:hypothetical protein
MFLRGCFPSASEAAIGLSSFNQLAQSGSAGQSSHAVDEPSSSLGDCLSADSRAAGLEIANDSPCDNPDAMYVTPFFACKFIGKQ